MDEFPGLLARDFGSHPQGKSAPMASSRGARSGMSSSSATFAPSYSSFAGKSGRESSDFRDPSPPDEVSGMYGSRSFQDHGGGMGDLDDIFAGTSKRQSSHSSSTLLNYDSVLDGLKDSASQKNSSAPVFDKPVYDEDIFDGIPGLKSSSNTSFDDVFAQMSASSNHTTPPFEDLLGTLSGKESKSSVLGDKPSTTAPPFDDLLGIGTKDHISSRPSEKPSSYDDILGSLGEKEQNSSDLKAKAFTETASMSMPAFDDLIPGFDGSCPPSKRNHLQAAKSQSSSTATQSATTTSHDPFMDLEPTSIPVNPSSGIFVDPLEDFSATSASKKNETYSSDAFSSVNGFNVSKKSPTLSSDLNGVSKNNSSLETPRGTINEYSASVNEYSGRSSAWNSVDTFPKKVTVDSHAEPPKRLFDVRVGPSQAAPPGRSGSQFADVNSNQDKINRDEQSKTANDIWLTVSEIPLFTLPTTAPPPSRPPPPLMPKRSPFSFNDKGASLKTDSKRKTAFNDFSSDSHNDSYRTFGVSSIDELEEFAKGKLSAADERSEVLSNEEDIVPNSAAATSAAAMKEAMDRAEAKFRHARELREREKESKSGKAREFVDLESDFPNQENAENLGSLECEQEEIERDAKEKEREAKEKEQRRIEKEREREHAREKAAVERALREARERAAVEARQKVERAAVQKANAEARERAARASVQRATAEAKERATAEARERAAAEAREKAAAEARERAATEAKERAAREASEREYREREAKLKAAAMTRERERAAVQRAAADARVRAERAAVERAHAEARERAAAAAREKLHNNENDLDSIFGMGTRANSEPKQRASTMDSPFDTQVRNKGGAPDGMHGASSSSSMRKASSSTNFLDDLNSVFGATASSGGFQEIDGESEERRRARLERHQRTLERATKALAEKNERDNQIQRDQAERHRISETLDVEIKRWAAGKEGNLRALLSTLQYVLWPECGWQPVSLTDLITAASVKKVYRKATLCIHPDKVQQKGATLQQKYIAEKVFDLLKEAWNKFNSEELF